MLKELEERIRRLEDIQDIKNLQARFQFYLGMLDADKIVECFARKEAGVSCEIGDRGVYLGIKQIRELFQSMQKVFKEKPGKMGHIMDMNSVIEVDKGGKTAVGLWYGFGPLSLPETTDPDKRDLTAMWIFGKYDMKYIKEDGKWKFLNFRFVLIFRTPFDQGWIKDPEALRLKFSNKPDKSPTKHMPYNPDIFNEFLPGPPDPQE